jgi:hypothetical protein
VSTEKTIQPNQTQHLLLQVIEQLTAVASSIGVMQGQINLLIAENQRAAQTRQTMYKKLNKIDPIESTLKRIEPLVDNHEERHNQAVGRRSFRTMDMDRDCRWRRRGRDDLREWLVGGHK